MYCIHAFIQYDTGYMYTIARAIYSMAQFIVQCDLGYMYSMAQFIVQCDLGYMYSMAQSIVQCDQGYVQYGTVHSTV